MELIQGKGKGILDPRGLAARAQVAAMLQRFQEKILACESALPDGAPVRQSAEGTGEKKFLQKM